MGGAQVTAPLFPLRVSRFDDPETTKQAPGLTGSTGPTWGFCQGSVWLSLVVVWCKPAGNTLESPALPGGGWSCVTSQIDYNRCAPTLSPKGPNSPAWRASHKGEWEHPKR